MTNSYDIFNQSIRFLKFVSWRVPFFSVISLAGTFLLFPLHFSTALNILCDSWSVEIAIIKAKSLLLNINRIKNEILLLKFQFFQTQMLYKNHDTKFELQVWEIMKSHYDLIVQFLVINFCEFRQMFFDKMSVRSAICVKTLLHLEIKFHSAVDENYSIVLIHRIKFETTYIF